MELGVYTFAELTPDASGGPSVTPQQRLRDLIEEVEPPSARSGSG